jgi:hypothetical protein
MFGELHMRRNASMNLSARMRTFTASIAFVTLASLFSSTVRGQGCIENDLVRLDGISRYVASIKPRRLVIVTPDNRQDRLHEHDSFSQSLAAYLRDTGQFEVIVAREKVCENKVPMRSGTFNEHDLLNYSRLYRADSILYLDITSMSGYEPMRMNMSFALISIREAIALVSGSLNVDLRSPFVYQEYANRTIQSSDDHSIDTHQNSPTRFLDFGAFKTANSLATIWEANTDSEGVLQVASTAEAASANH